MASNATADFAIAVSAKRGSSCVAMGAMATERHLLGSLLYIAALLAG